MRNYNFCTLKVLDNYHNNKDKVKQKEMEKEKENTIGREGSEEDSILPEIIEENSGETENNIESSSLECGTQNNFGSFSGRPASSTGKINFDVPYF